MLKNSAVIFFLLFSFMSGVILGAKKERTKLLTKQTPVAVKPLVNPKSLKITAPKKIDIKTAENDHRGPDLDDFYTIVLASFSSAESAQKHVENIKRQGFRPFYFTKEISGKTWHRVGIGSFKLKRDALELQKELSENKFAKGSLISKITANNE